MHVHIRKWQIVLLIKNVSNEIDQFLKNFRYVLSERWSTKC